jgi:peptide/nickel transport system substrate-binding protein
MPSAVYFGRLAAGTFSAALNSWGSATGEPNTYLTALLATPDRARGRGTINTMGFADPRLDALIDQALAESGRDPRAALWRAATRLALTEDVGLLPLHHQVNLWAMRRGLAFTAHPDELTIVTRLWPAP